MRILAGVGSLLLAVTGWAGLTLVTAGAASAATYSYPQDGWHLNSVFADGTSKSTSVIDCQSSIIANMGGGTSYDSDGWTYTPPMTVTPTTGVIGAMGAEVNLDEGHPRIGESFYIHVWARSISTPCGFQGVVPVFTLPDGLSIDTAGHTVCFFDGQPENDATCPQPGSAKFQSASSTTGKPNSWQILCGYASGCYDTYYWPTVMGHGVEIAVPVKASKSFNGTVTGGAVINTDDVPTYYPMQAALNVFATDTGSGVTPPASSGNPSVPDPGYAYRVRYDNPSTKTSANYELNPAWQTTYGVLSRAEVFTNHVPGQVVFIRDTDKSRITAAPTTVSGFNGSYHNQVRQWALGSIDNSGDSFQSEFDWRPTGNGSDASMPVAPGKTYYWRYGYLPYPDGVSPSGQIVWGAVQSFATPATTCNGLTPTVSIGLGELPTPGDDVIVGTPGNDAINGLGGNDTICGGGGNDTIDGGAGNDAIFGEAGNDVLMGGDGNDTIRGGTGDDVLLPGLGLDTAYGEDGFDTVSYADVTTPYNSSTAPYTGVWICSNVCSSGFFNVAGAAGLDEIGANNATQGHIAWPERIVGTGFNDVFDPLESGTVVAGGAGDDTMAGGPGVDTFMPGAGHDTVTGGAGDVVSYADMSAGVVASLAPGMASSDVITGVRTLVGGRGNDTLVGTAGNDRISGGGGKDTIRAGAGNDIVTGDAGDDRIDGGAGSDRLTGGTGNDHIDGIGGNDVAHGGAGNDVITGGTGNDKLYGEAGRDTVRGGAGNDTVNGGAGNDRLYGDAGKDRVTGGPGKDLLNGGSRKDVCMGGPQKDRAKSCEKKKQIP